MTNYEERVELMKAARHVLRELAGVTKRVHILVNKLIGEADKLAIAAADEKQAGEQVSVKRLVYGKPEAPASPPSLAPGKRACSACRQPGHRKGSPECALTIEAYTGPRKGKKEKTK